MPYISNREYAEYKRIKALVNEGKILTYAGLSLIIKAADYSPEEIGKIIIGQHAKIKADLKRHKTWSGGGNEA